MLWQAKLSGKLALQLVGKRAGRSSPRAGRSDRGLPVEKAFLGLAGIGVKGRHGGQQRPGIGMSWIIKGPARICDLDHFAEIHDGDARADGKIV
jgi:hypothetical protein